MNYIVAAILSNLSYAFADNANGLTAKKNPPVKIALYATLFGTIIFLFPLLVFFRSDLASLTLTNLLIVVAVDILVNIGYLSFLMGMSRGSVTLTGVIGGSFPALTTVLALAFFGETVSLAQAAAIALVIAGVALSSLHGSRKTFFKELRSSGLIFALGAFVFWGIYFALIRIPIERVGWFLPQYLSNIIGLAIFFIVAKFFSKNDETGWPKLPLFIALAAFLQVSGSMFFNYAITQGNTSIVAPIAGSSPAVFVLFAFFIFKEKLGRLQWLGIFFAILGIVALSLAS